ncbi:terminase small subunit [Pseudomonas benzopyrenica]|uniref:terminase small subunit n=1 Tax=Pseudomonas benzopyrenica TaxID=2993566 RepID=UPI003F18CB58
MTTKKDAFVRQVLAGATATKAAIAAGYAKGSAAVQGSRLMKDPDVIHALGAMRKAVPEEHRQALADDEDVDLATLDPDCPLTVMRQMMRDKAIPPSERLKAAIGLAPYLKSKHGGDALLGGKLSKRESALITMLKNPQLWPAPLPGQTQTLETLLERYT